MILSDYLDNQKVDKGEDYTHTCLKRNECYYIRSNTKFNDLYIEALLKGESLHITEKHKTISPILIDLDFRQAVKERLYDEEYVRVFLNTLVSTLKRYVDQDELSIYVLEKESPRKHKELYKDGIHVIIPDVITVPMIQYKIRSDIISFHKENVIPKGVINEVAEIYDEAVIERNNWFMYGSKKPDEKYPWKVTQAYKIQGNETIEIINMKLEEFVKLFSIRSPNMEESRYTKEGKMVMKVKRGSTKDSVMSFATSKHESTLISDLVNLLSIERADKYETWIRVGWCLHNIDRCLLDLWIEFSKKSSKYIDGECDDLWETMMSEGGLNIGSLHMWVKEDSPLGYIDVISKHASQENDLSIDDLRKSTKTYSYNFVKSIFEKTHSKIMRPVSYIETDKDSETIRDEVSLKKAYRNIYCQVIIDKKNEGSITKNVKFIDKWLDDCHIKTYRKLTFAPTPMQEDNRDLNLWHGFAIDRIVGVESSKNIDSFIEHTKLLVGYNEDAHKYFITWLAQLIQQPGKLNGIALIFLSEEGAGKNIFWDHFAKIIGKEYYFETPNPEKDLFGQFSNGRKYKLLIDIDEANSKDTFANSELLKNMITSEHFNYEQKGIDPIELPNFARVVFTTNNLLCAKITDSTRRYVIFETSNSRIGEQRYFEDLLTYFKDVRNQKAIIEYLRGIDISKVNWIRDRPLTGTYHALKSICADPLLKYLTKIWKDNRNRDYIEILASKLLQDYHIFLSDNLKMKEDSVNRWTPMMFGIRIKSLCNDNKTGMAKEKRRCYHYTFDIKKLKYYLESKGMLSEDTYMFLEE